MQIIFITIIQNCEYMKHDAFTSFIAWRTYYILVSHEHYLILNDITVNIIILCGVYKSKNKIVSHDVFIEFQRDFAEVTGFQTARITI